MFYFNNLDSPISSPSRRPNSLSNQSLLNSSNQMSETGGRTMSLTERGRPTEKRSATLGTKRLGKVRITHAIFSIDE